MACMREGCRHGQLARGNTDVARIKAVRARGGAHDNHETTALALKALAQTMPTCANQTKRKTADTTTLPCLGVQCTAPECGGDKLDQRREQRLEAPPIDDTMHLIFGKCHEARWAADTELTTKQLNELVQPDPDAQADAEGPVQWSEDNLAWIDPHHGGPARQHDPANADPLDKDGDLHSPMPSTDCNSTGGQVTRDIQSTNPARAILGAPPKQLALHCQVVHEGNVDEDKAWRTIHHNCINTLWQCLQASREARAQAQLAAAKEQPDREKWPMMPHRKAREPRRPHPDRPQTEKDNTTASSEGEGETTNCRNAKQTTKDNGKRKQECGESAVARLSTADEGGSHGPKRKMREAAGTNRKGKRAKQKLPRRAVTDKRRDDDTTKPTRDTAVGKARSEEGGKGAPHVPSLPWSGGGDPRRMWTVTAQGSTCSLNNTCPTDTAWMEALAL